MNSKISLILKLTNAVAVLAVLGLFVYTKILFKRPAITEAQERQKLIERSKKRESATLVKKGLVPLETISSNLDSYVGADGKSKNHLLTMTGFIEIRNEKEISKFETVRPIVMDRIIQNLGKKKYEDLNQVQGRYVFRSQIIDAANESMGAPIVTDVYFGEFLLQ